MKVDRHKLLRIITETSFALDDVILYLDTHPEDKDALAYYDKVKKIRKQAWDDYTKMYGPLSAYDVDVKNTWTWVCQPWPWELEG